jgi:flagellar basal-body rod protein FlgC
MGINGIASSVDIAISGLRAESTRMNVIAGNIANSKTTKTPSGKPYRRKEMVLSTSGSLNGVEIKSISADMSTAFKEVHIPGHPQADKNGNVLMPNVDMPVEMINLVSASRAYQANAAVLKRYQEVVDTAITLLK